MIRFFEICWPALLPTFIYIVWVLLKRKRARARGEILPSFTRTGWYKVILATLLIIMMSLLTVGAEQTPTPEGYKSPWH